MKKFLLFLTLFLSAVGLAQAAEKSYAIVFTSATSDGSNNITASNLKSATYISAGIDYISSFTEATKVYPGKNGLKLGTGSAIGSFTVSLAKTKTVNAQVTPTKIVIEAAKYSSDTGKIKLTINKTEISVQQQPTSTDLDYYTWEFTGTSALNEVMTSLTIATTAKRAYIKSITVYYEEGTSGGEDEKDCGIAFTSASGEVTYPGTDYALPFKNDNKVDVTFTSTEAGVATVANDSNMPKLSIVGCGTTTIKASYASDGTYDDKEVSFTLTVNQGTPALSFARTSYTANLGEAFALPELADVPDGAIISWTSTATDVAEFVDGVLTIKAAGSTTITATTSATALFTEGNASFTLEVTDPNNTTIALVFGDVENSLVTNNTAIGTIQYNGIKFEFLQGGHSQLAPVYDNSDKTARIYKQNEFTITLPTGYTFEKIEFTSSDTSIKNLLGGSESDGSLTITESTKSALWTPAAIFVSNSVTFKGNTSATTRIASITVYIKAPLADDDAGLAFANATDNATYGIPYTLQALTNPKSVDVDWSSSVTDVAEFADGVLEIKKAGTTTITASATDSKYTTNNTASYTLTIAKGKPGLAFAAATVNKIVGDAAFTNELTNPNSLAVTYSTEPTESSVATVDANTGEVTVLAAGEVTIVASSAETENYNVGTASYTLKVVDTKLYDTFNASNLTFDGESGYRNFTYTTANGAVYGGFADINANGTTLMIQNQASGKSGIFVSQAPAGYKLHTITVSNATGSADLTLYGSTKSYASVSTDGKSIATIESGKKNEIFVNGYTATLGAYGIIPTTFSICGADKASSVTEITVIWEVDTREEAQLAYSTTEVTLAEREALTQPTLNNPKTLPVTYSTDNDAVATVTAEGVISLAGATGTAVITAYSDGNASYKPASTTFTITVKKAQVAYLVTDASTLQPGDIIIIANQEDAVAFATTKSTSTSGAKSPTAITLSNYNNEIISISDNVMLFEVGNDVSNEVTYYTFKTTNYLGTDGYIGNYGTSNGCYVDATISARNRATVSIDAETGVATINFNKGASNQNTYLTYNSSSPGYFNCYAINKQKPVYIYKVTDKPATVSTQTSDFTFAAKGEKENLNVIELQNYFTTSTTASKVAIYLENVLVGTYDVDASGNVYADMDYIPYLPTAKFTMRPVLKEEGGVPTQVGPAEALEFTWPAIKDEATFGFGLYDEAIFCVNEDSATGPWNLYGQFTFLDDFKVENLDYSVEVTAVKNEYDELPSEFAWGNGGFIVTIPDFFSSLKWDTNTGHPDITGCEVPVVTFTIISSYEFTYDIKYSSLVTGGAAAPARLAAPAETAKQKVTGLAQELTSTLTATSDVSGVEGVSVDADDAAEYFNLQGVRVDGDLAPGIYIRRQGRNVSKIQIN